METVAREKFFQSKIASAKLGEMLASLARVWGFHLDHSAGHLTQRINQDFHISTTFALTQLFMSKKINPALFGSIGCLWSFYLAKCSSSSLKAAHSNSTQEVLDISVALDLASRSFGLTPTIVSVLKTVKSYDLTEAQEVFDIIDRIITENDEQNEEGISNNPQDLERKNKQLEELLNLIQSLVSKEDPSSIADFFSNYQTKCTQIYFNA